jgi:hypothetical protein
VDRIVREFGGQPSWPPASEYRETITRAAQAKGALFGKAAAAASLVTPSFAWSMPTWRRIRVRKPIVGGIIPRNMSLR